MELPCEVCGATRPPTRAEGEDAFHTVVGSREKPLNDIDVRLAEKGMRLERRCARCRNADTKETPR